MLANDLLDQGTDICIAQFCLGLTFKLCIGQLNGNNCSDTFPAIFTGNLVVTFNNAVFHTVSIENAGQSGFEAGLMHTAFGGINFVGKTQNGFIIAIVVLQGNFRTGISLHAAHIDDITMDCRFITVAPGDKLPDTTFIAHGILDNFVLPFIGNADSQTGCQKSLFPHTGMQNLVIINSVIKHLGIRLEGNFRTGFIGLANNRHFLGDMSPGKFHLIDVTFFMHPYPEPLGQSVDDGSTDTMQAAGNLISATAEFTTGMQHSKYNFQCRLTCLRLDVYGDTTTIIGNGNRVTGIDGHSNIFTVSGQSFVNGIIHNFIDQVVQTGRRSRSDIHTGSFSDCFQTFQNLDLLSAIFLCYFHFF